MKNKLLIIFIIIFLYINSAYSNLYKETYDGNQPDYCSTLTKSDATKYDFYKCSYFEKIREKNKIHIPTRAELYQKRLKESIERERKRNEQILKESKKKIESEWQSRMNKNIVEHYRITKANELINKGMDLAKKSLCVNTNDCIDAIYLYKESLSLNYRKDILDGLDALYLMLAAQYNKQNKYNKAIEYALLSNNIELSNGILTDSYNLLAKKYYYDSEYDSSIEYGLLSISKGTTNKWYPYYINGLSSYKLEEYKNALFYFKKSLINTNDKENIKTLNYNIEITNNKINELKKIDIKESVVIKEPKNDKQCKNKNGINSYFDNKGYCLCKEGFEFSETSGYTVCEEKQSLVLRKKIDKKILVKLDNILPKLLLKPEKILIKLRDKINILLKKKIDKKTKDILLYIKLIINDKLFNSIDLDNLLN